MDREAWWATVHGVNKELDTADREHTLHLNHSISQCSDDLAAILRASLAAQVVKNPPEMQEILVWFLDAEDPLEKG